METHQYRPAYNPIILAAIIGGVILFVFTWPLWRSLMLAALLAYLLHPLVERLERRWPGRRGLWAGVVYAGFLLLLLTALSFAGTTLWQQVTDWLAEAGEAAGELQQWLERPFTILGFTMRPQLIWEYLRNSAATAVSSVSLSDGRRLLDLTNNLLWGLVILVSLFYFLRDGHRILPGLVPYVPPKYRGEARELLQELIHIWGIFLRVQLLIFAVLGLLVLASTSLLVWLFRQGWLPLSPLGLIILLIVVYSAIQQVDNLWLRPQYMGQALKLHPGVVFVSLIAALALTGFLGALLIVPALASLKVIALFLHRRFVPEAEAT